MTDTDIAPPRTKIDEEKFMAVWPRMDAELKSECLRMEKEILRGQAILKDRALGHPKYDQSGFYGLELATEDVYRLEQVPRKAAELAKARAIFSELKSSLAEDEEQWQRHTAMHEALEPYREHAAAQRMTLFEYLTKCRTIELALYRGLAAREAGNLKQCSNEVFDAICQIADWIGFDPVEMLMKVANSPDPRVAH